MVVRSVGLGVRLCLHPSSASVNYYSLFLLFPLFFYPIAPGHKLFSLSSRVCYKMNSDHPGQIACANEISLLLAKSEDGGRSCC